MRLLKLNTAGAARPRAAWRRALASAAFAFLFAFACVLPASPIGSTAGAPEAGQNPAPQATPPPPAAPRPVTVPRPVERTLRNGLRVIVVERHDMPLVSAQLAVRNGGEVDPAQLSGLADLTAELLTKGTKTRTAPQVAQQIEALGATLESGAGWDASRVSVNVMSSKVEPALRIVADVVRNPVFQDEEIERQRQLYLDNLSVAMNDPGRLASFVAARVVFGDAPYGHPVSGTPESLPRIRREDIAALHARYYRPDNAQLVVGGAIKAAEAFRLAERLFGDWPRPSAPLENAGGGPGKRMTTDVVRRVVVVDMPGAGQAAVALARPGIRRTDPDYYKGLVTNSVLSGYSGRLNQEIRIKRGLSYGARSALEARRETGPFVATTQTKNESGAEVASLLVGELRKLTETPVEAVELTPRQAVLVGGFGRALETTDGLVAQVASLALYGLDLGELNGYVNRVQAVTPADIRGFVGSRLDPSGASIVVVGDARQFLDALRKEFGEVEVIPAAQLDLNTGRLRKAAEGDAKK
ncbi:MAG TPA: pitrilysin family protein [Pyrinomonadaceae bacterium]|nr:pitrilysin family protein [Pyrinomonadaceae bacterium]